MKRLFSIFIKLFILVALTTSCANQRMREFKLKEHNLKLEGRVHPNFKKKQQTVFIIPKNRSLSIKDKQFVNFSNYVYVALEQRGFKRSYSRSKANIIVELSYFRQGPFQLKRTGINHYWENWSPFIENDITSSATETQATYDFLKKQRDIKYWRKNQEKFIFKYNVFLTTIKLRGILRADNKTLFEPLIAFENTITALGQNRRFKSAFIAGIAGTYEDWLQDIQKPKITVFDHNDPRAFDFYEKVVAEVYYQKTNNTQVMYENHRNLDDKEIKKYYLNRKKQFDLNPLYVDYDAIMD